MEAPVSIDNKPKTLPPYGPPPPHHHPPHPASHPLHHPPPPGPQPRMLPPSDGPHHALPTPHGIYDQQWRQPYPHPHYESADQRRHSTAGQPPHPPPHPSYAISQPSRELPQLPSADPYPRPNSLPPPPPPPPPPTHSPSDAHPPHSYRPMNGAPPETAPPHSAPGEFRQPRNPYAPPHETPAPHHAEPPGPQFMSQMPPPVPQTPSAAYDYPFARQRKAARAQQACDQCRARKAKCDEGRPSCSHCKENNIPCVYKEIPPHKQEKATQVLLDRIERLEDRMEARFREMFDLFTAHGGVPLAAIEKTKVAIEPGESPPSAQEAAEPSPDSSQNESASAQKTPKEIKDNENSANDVLMSDVPLDEGSTASESTGRIKSSLNGLPATSLPKANIPLSSLPNSNMPLSGLPAKSLPNSHLPVNNIPRPGFQNHVMNEIAMKSYRLAEKFDEIANPPLDDEKLAETGDGELSIPLEHTTAAHKLLSWPSINRLLESNIDMDYVMKGEEDRGLIRIYGCGEGREDDSEFYDDKKHSIGGSPMTASSSPFFDDETSQPSFPLWGVGLPSSAAPYRPTERLPERSGDQRGGLDAFGQLNTNPDTVRDLHRSYMENLHILHPFLDEVVLDHKISNFIKKYGSIRKNPTSQTGSTGSTEFRSAKRKRSSEAMHVSSAEMSRSPSSHSNFEKWPQPQRIERSIDSAIVLLVLALGAICDCKDRIPPLRPDNDKKNGSDYASPSTRASLNHILSPDSDSYSPGMPFHSPRLTSDDVAARRMGPMRPPSAAGLENLESIQKNMDVIPGLAYYAHATDILGNLQGGSGLLHVQAALLAGLYAGQLAHPFQSYGWIHQASRACLVLVRSKKYSAMKEGPMKDLHDFAYWTCLQLESDILAELDLPASGISRSEGRIDLPKGHFTLRLPQNPKNSTMMFFYSAQIHLRKVLNQIHTDLYKVGSGKDGKSGNPEQLGFSSSVLEVLGMNLEFWRKSLPDHMNWDEDDPPSSDINVARLRAKYYGARYIIYRPLLHYALHHSMGPDFSQPFGERGPKSEQGSFSTQTPQASSMTRWSSDTGISGDRSDDIYHTVEWEKLPGLIQHACETCINAAIRSTQAFHGIKGRPIITGIFGTAHAQFGNMLVLSATYMSNLRHLIERDKLEELFIRTIKFLWLSKNVSPTLQRDALILAGIYHKIFNKTPQTSFTE